MADKKTQDSNMPERNLLTATEEDSMPLKAAAHHDLYHFEIILKDYLFQKVLHIDI